MSYSPAPLALDRAKPSPWNVEGAFVAPTALWDQLRIFHPLWEGSGGPYNAARDDAHGIMPATPPTWTATSSGVGLSFDESDDYYTLARDDYLDLGAEWTFVFYMRVADNAGSAYQYFISQETFAQPNSYNFYIIEDSAGSGNDIAGGMKAVIDPGGTGSEQNVISTAVFPSDDWKLVALRKKPGDTAAAWLVDAVDVTDFADGSLGTVTNNDIMYVGRREDAEAARYFGGELSWWGKWDRALLDSELRLLTVEPFALMRPNWDYVTAAAAFDPANLQASVLGSDVTLTHDASF